MTLEELKIQLDLNEPVDILKFVGRQTKDNDWFVVCDEGDCHLFDDNGNEIDVKKIMSLNEKLIPKDIKKIIIPDSIEYIKKYTFFSCENLTSITIPDSVEHIGYDVFYACKNLKSLTFKGKTIEQVKSMEWYPWGIYDKFIIKCIS